MRSSLFCAYFSRFSSEVCYYNLSPQGDGNNLFVFNRPIKGNYNLSPQGDGNSRTADWTPSTPNYNLSPQGDGNPLRSWWTRRSSITTYPRKGTVTGGRLLTKHKHTELQLIPARGRKPTQFSRAIRRSRITTYPRKGTVTA